MRTTAFLAALTLAIAACTSGDGGTAGGPNGATQGPGGGQSTRDGQSGSGDGSSGGGVVQRQEPGRGYASVDGREFSFDTPGALACSVAEDEVSFSYSINGNEVVFGGGASISGGQWFGSITLRIFADNAFTEYSAQIVENPSGMAIDGDSVSYSGPMVRFDPTSDGTSLDPVPVGDGVFSATCG